MTRHTCLMPNLASGVQTWSNSPTYATTSLKKCVHSREREIDIYILYEYTHVPSFKTSSRFCGWVFKSMSMFLLRWLNSVWLSLCSLQAWTYKHTHTDTHRHTQKAWILIFAMRYMSIYMYTCRRCLGRGLVGWWIITKNIEREIRWEALTMASTHVTASTGSYTRIMWYMLIRTQVENKGYF